MNTREHEKAIDSNEYKNIINICESLKKENDVIITETILSKAITNINLDDNSHTEALKNLFLLAKKQNVLTADLSKKILKQAIDASNMSSHIAIQVLTKNQTLLPQTYLLPQNSIDDEILNSITEKLINNTASSSLREALLNLLDAAIQTTSTTITSKFLENLLNSNVNYHLRENIISAICEKERLVKLQIKMEEKLLIGFMDSYPAEKSTWLLLDATVKIKKQLDDDGVFLKYWAVFKKYLDSRIIRPPLLSSGSIDPILSIGFELFPLMKKFSLKSLQIAHDLNKTHWIATIYKSLVDQKISPEEILTYVVHSSFNYKIGEEIFTEALKNRDTEFTLTLLKTIINQFEKDVNSNQSDSELAKKYNDYIDLIANRLAMKKTLVSLDIIKSTMTMNLPKPGSESKEIFIQLLNFANPSDLSEDFLQEVSEKYPGNIPILQDVITIFQNKGISTNGNLETYLKAKPNTNPADKAPTTPQQPQSVSSTTSPSSVVVALKPSHEQVESKGRSNFSQSNIFAKSNKPKLKSYEKEYSTEDALCIIFSLGFLAFTRNVVKRAQEKSEVLGFVIFAAGVFLAPVAMLVGTASLFWPTQKEKEVEQRIKSEKNNYSNNKFN